MPALLGCLEDSPRGKVIECDVKASTEKIGDEELQALLDTTDEKCSPSKPTMIHDNVKSVVTTNKSVNTEYGLVNSYKSRGRIDASLLVSFAPSLRTASSSARLDVVRLFWLCGRTLGT